MSKLLSPLEAADFLGVAPRTLTIWRHRGYGPVFKKVGRLVKYSGEDLEAWVQSQTRTSTAQQVV